MSEMLTAEKIASLVEAAKTGELPESGAGPAARAHRVRSVDFSRPTKFTTEQQRRITRGVETFCQTANTRLSAELRIPVEFELLNAVQLTWAAAQNQLPPGTLSALIDVDPIGTRMLFAARAVVRARLPGGAAGRHDRIARGISAGSPRSTGRSPAGCLSRSCTAVARVAGPGRPVADGRRAGSARRRAGRFGLRAHADAAAGGSDRPAIVLAGPADSVARGSSPRWARSPAVRQAAGRRSAPPRRFSARCRMCP